MKKVFLIVAGIIMAVVLPISIFLVKNQQDIRSKAAPATTLSLTPTTLSEKIDDMFTLEATIDTGENQVFVAELHIGYDPTKLEAISITNGPLFPNIILSGKIDPAGKITITLGAENQSSPITGTGVAAIVKFKAVGATTAPTVVHFVEPDTFVGAKQEGATNVLIGTTPSKIVISGSSIPLAGAGFLSPTPSSILFPSTTLSPTPTQGATASSSSTLVISSPSETVPATTTRPLFQGTAPNNASVTLIIHPSAQTISVRANSAGIWSYTPTSPLAEGPHEVTATSVDPISNGTLTATRTFVIAASTGEGSQDGTPVSGNISTTLLFLVLGIGLVGAGILVPHSIR